MRVLKGLLAGIAGALLIVPSAYSSPVAACAAGSYSTYDVAGFSCTINGLLFDSFTFSSSGNPSGIIIPVTGVTVTPITTPGDEGFTFNLGSSVGNQGTTSDFQDELIQFHVSTVDLSATIQDLTLYFNGSVTGAGTSNVTENYCVSHPLVGCPNGNSGQIHVTNPPPSFNDVVVFSGQGVSGIWVSKDINATSGSIACPQNQPVCNTASVSQVVNTFTHGQVPEPWSMVLVGGGLVGIGLIRRLRRS